MKVSPDFKNMFLACTVIAVVASSVAFADDIQDAPGGHWGGGALIGRRLRGARQGIIWSTFELQVNYGGIANSAQYTGTTINMSTQSARVFEQFQHLSPNRDYIFEFTYPHPLNPVYQSTHFLVTAIREVRADFEASGLPRSIETHSVREGNYGHGEKLGVISQVFRWGFTDNTCSVTVNMGGHSSTGHEEMLDFAIYGETNCNYAQQVMAFGREVNIKFSEDTIEFWDADDHIIHSIEVVQGGASATSELPQSQAGAAPQNVTPAPQLTYEQLRQRLLQDPDFIRQVREIPVPAQAPQVTGNEVTMPGVSLRPHVPGRH